MKKKSENTGINKKRRTRVDLLPPAVLLGLAVFWQAGVMLTGIPDYLLPSPANVVKELVKMREVLLLHTLATLKEALLGLLFSIALGIIFGLLIGYFDTLRRALHPLFVISQTIPLVVLAPLFAVWFGFGLLPKILIIILVCFFPIALTLGQGLLRSDPDGDALLRVMGATRWRIFRLSRIPQALPDLFSGLKISATYSIMGAVISEWVGAKEGLGIYLTRAMTSFKTAAMFADILIIVVLSLVLYKLVELLESRVCRNLLPDRG